MAAGDPITRAGIAAMTPAEFGEREAEIDRWYRAGAVDGQAVTPSKRPDGHKFTRAEIADMSSAEFGANEAAIDVQMKAGLIK